MNFSIKQDILIEQLNYVIKGVSTKNLIPILSCIKFVLLNEGLYLLSTDNEMAIKSFIPKDKIETIECLGEIVISGKYIYDIIKKLPGEIIHIEEVANSKIFINTNNSEFNLNCNNANEFPNLEIETIDNPIKISKQVFKNMINQTYFATSSQESRPTLTGINFFITPDKIECTATDSYRLSKKVLLLDSNYDNINITIPIRNLLELVKIINEENNFLEIHIFTNKVIFKFDNIEFLTRVINGTFPDTRKLIPETFEIEIILDYKDFFSAIDRASLLSSLDEKNTILFELINNNIKISSNIPEIGMVEEKLIAKSKNGTTNLKISFSSKFMCDAIKAINSNEIILKFNGDIKPIIIRNPNSELLTELIVPIRTY
ncbi:MAG: DNA polymerase III subunit beta [Bacilli bacterium]